MAFMRPLLLLRAGTRLNTARSPVEAGMHAHIYIVDVYVIHVGVVNDRRIHMHHGSVIGKVTALPAPAPEARAAIAEAVVNAAIEADVRPPVAFMEDECAAAPAPIARSPQQANLRRPHPHSRHPVVSRLRRIRPVARVPEIPIARRNRLHIDRQRRRRKAYRDKYARERSSRRQNHRRCHKGASHCTHRKNVLHLSILVFRRDEKVDRGR